MEAKIVFSSGTPITPYLKLEIPVFVFVVPPYNVRIWYFDVWSPKYASICLWVLGGSQKDKKESYSLGLITSIKCRI
jgi:hypothetical protein